MATLADVDEFAEEVWKRKTARTYVVVRFGNTSAGARSKANRERMVRIGPDGRSDKLPNGKIDPETTLEHLYDGPEDLAESLTRIVESGRESSNAYLYAHTGQGAAFHQLPINDFSIDSPDIHDRLPASDGTLSTSAMRMYELQIQAEVGRLNMVTQLNKEIGRMSAESARLRLENGDLEGRCAMLQAQLDQYRSEWDDEEDGGRPLVSKKMQAAGLQALEAVAAGLGFDFKKPGTPAEDDEEEAVTPEEALAGLLEASVDPKTAGSVADVVIMAWKALASSEHGIAELRARGEHLQYCLRWTITGVEPGTEAPSEPEPEPEPPAKKPRKKSRKKTGPAPSDEDLPPEPGETPVEST